MNWYFVSVGFVLFATAVVHSVMGKRLIFRRLRGRGWIPTEGGQVLPEAHVRILWANWHLVSALGGGFALVLTWLALPSSTPTNAGFVAPVMAASTLAGSMLVLVATKGRHPGWISLLLAAFSTMFSLLKHPLHRLPLFWRLQLAGWFAYFIYGVLPHRAAVRSFHQRREWL